jgi:hypothetical protein
MSFMIQALGVCKIKLFTFKLIRYELHPTPHPNLSVGRGRKNETRVEVTNALAYYKTE